MFSCLPCILFSLQVIYTVISLSTVCTLLVISIFLRFIVLMCNVVFLSCPLARCVNKFLSKKKSVLISLISDTLLIEQLIY